MRNSLWRQRFVARPVVVCLLLFAATLLSACGGGATDAPVDGPVIAQFTADRGTYFVGEKARLTVSYRGGAGRIEPGIGAVASGAVVETPTLDRGVSYRLVVEGAGRSVSHSLALAVNFRDRFAVLNVPFVSSEHAAVTTGDGAVLIVGGSRGARTLSESIDRFDPATRTFTRIGSMRTGRSGHTATRLADGRVLVVGGLASLSIGNFAELIDARTGAVAHGGDVVLPRFWHATTLLADGRVLVTGGFGHNSAELWDPATGAWRLVAARMTQMRWQHTATLLEDGRVLIAGGQSAGAAYQFAELFDPRTESFTPVPSAGADVRRLHAAHRLGDGSVLIVGGETLTADGDIVGLTSTLRFEPAANRFVAAAPLATARTLTRSIALPDDRILLFGGETPDAQPSASGEAYLAAQGGKALASMPQERMLHSVSRLPDGRILVVGGEGVGGDYRSQVLLYE